MDSRRASSHSRGMSRLIGDGSGAVAVEDMEVRKGNGDSESGEVEGGVIRAVGSW